MYIYIRVYIYIHTYTFIGQCDELLHALPSSSKLNGFAMSPMEFEKDDDAHMRVVASIGNLRARNYKIPEVDLHL
jgi:ubiquitin-activating enzyme E1